MDDTDAAAWVTFYTHVLAVRERCRTRPGSPNQGPSKKPPRVRPVKPSPPPVLRRPRFNRHGKLLLWLRRRDERLLARYQSKPGG